MNPSLVAEIQNIVFAEGILTIASEIDIGKFNRERARDSMMTICSNSVFEIYPVPYGKYIKISIGVSNTVWFNEKQLDVATHFLIIHCSDPKRITNKQYGDIYSAIKSRNVDNIKSAIESLNDVLNSKVKNWKGNE